MANNTAAIATCEKRRAGLVRPAVKLRRSRHQMGRRTIAGSDQRERTFRQEAEAGGESSKRRPRRRNGLHRIRGAHRAPDRRRDEEGERQIRQREPRHCEVAVTGRCDGARDPGAIRIPGAPPSCGPCQQHEPETGKRRAEARHELGRVGSTECCGCKPVIEDRFLPALFVVEVRREPVLAFDHLARGFRVEGFVGIRDGLAAEAEEKSEA